MNLLNVLPPLAEGGDRPIWDGAVFKMGDQIAKVLQYSIDNKGWNDDLTFFHEESAGENHFIDTASRQHAIRQLKKNITTPHPTILEIGCSSGFMLKKIKTHFTQATVLGADVVTEPLQKLAEELPGTPLFRFDMTHCPFPDNSVDAIVMLNVLEHIEKDENALQQVYRILKPGGIAVIEVPAGPHLYDIYDKMLMHYRRYTLNELKAKLTHAGFNIQSKSHLGFFLYPGFSLVKKRNKKLLDKPIQDQKKAVEKNIQATGSNKLLHFVMQVELFLGKFLGYPRGIRCLVTCVKKHAK